MPRDPDWPLASDWLGGDHIAGPSAALAVVGAPVRLGSISGGRFERAPEAIRRALARFSTYDPETEVDVREVRVRDLGDVGVAGARPEEAAGPVEEAVAGALRDADAVVLLGGDNSITRPGARALGARLDRVGLLTLDAHHDLRQTAGGLTNGNPVRALLEDGLPGRNVVQIGIQPFANSPRHASDAREAGITVFSAGAVLDRGLVAAVREALRRLDRRADAIYVDLDLDVLDRSFAPACPGSRPGGLLPLHAQEAARMVGRHPKVRAFDLVEVDPERDAADATTLVAASCLLSFAAGLAARNG